MSERFEQPPRDEVIEPADFRPADPQDWRSGPRVRPAALALVGGMALLLAAVAFTFTAQPVLLAFEPDADRVSISGGLSLPVGERRLMRPGAYRVQAAREGYHPIDAPIEVARGETPVFDFEFEPLPGELTLTSTPIEGARVRIDGADVGATPIEALEVEAGERDIVLESERYLPWSQTVEIEGRGIAQSIEATLEPAWAEVTFESDPPGAEISLADGTVLETTPATVELLEGIRHVTLKKDGHKAWQRELEITAGEAQRLDAIELEPADGLLMVTSNPPGATVNIDGNYRGRTPLELELAPGKRHRVDLFRPGHRQVRREVTVPSGGEERLAVELPPELGEVAIEVEPEDATLLVNGRDAGNARQVLSLPAVTHEIELRKDGYVPYRTSITPRPGFPQEISVRMQTVEEARRAAIREEIETAAGQRLRLLRPGSFTMGASRREPGRRANEVLREVTLTRPFYLSETEVTNAQFRRFEEGHDSGEWEGRSLNDDDQPVVNVSWQQAALYCNWLSRQDDLPEAYLVENGRVVGFDPDATGYRLPTEAEWAWAARVKKDGSQLRFPWGDSMPPPDRHGNYADRTVANLLGRTIPGYTDGHAVSAPVASFEPNQHGLYDMGGNVSEWVNDFYGATSEDLPSGVVDPLGPPEGQYHVIRGASWRHGTATDLRLSFRDFGTDGRRDVGFRIARFLE